METRELELIAALGINLASIERLKSGTWCVTSAVNEKTLGELVYLTATPEEGLRKLLERIQRIESHLHSKN